MANNVRLIYDGTNYYISGGGSSQTAYTGSGTPWTSQSTTPYEIAMNDVMGERYTPQAPEPLAVYGGGAPFSIGQHLAYKGYGNVTETIPIQMVATSHDSAVFLLQQLRRILSTALFSVPCILAVQPNGATNIVYYNIYHATVQEDPRFLNEEAGLNRIRALITWTRSAFGGLATTAETVLSSASYGNTGTGSPDNVVAYSTGSGDLIYEGQPLNLQIAASDISKLYLSSIYERTYTTTGTSTPSTSSTTFVDGASITSIDVANAMTRRGLKCRILMQLTSPASNVEVRIVVRIGGSIQTGTLYTSGAIAPGTTTPQIVDFGGFSLDAIRDTNTANAQIDVKLQIRSTNGSSASVTLTFTEILLYYNFFVVSTTDATDTKVVTFVERAGMACLPLATPTAFRWSTASSIASDLYTFRGTPPRYYSGASLWAAKVRAAGTRVTGDTFTITATHAPLYHTLRGGG